MMMMKIWSLNIRFDSSLFLLNISVQYFLSVEKPKWTWSSCIWCFLLTVKKRSYLQRCVSAEERYHDNKRWKVKTKCFPRLMSDIRSSSLLRVFWWQWRPVSCASAPSCCVLIMLQWCWVNIKGSNWCSLAFYFCQNFPVSNCWLKPTVIDYWKGSLISQFTDKSNQPWIHLNILTNYCLNIKNVIFSFIRHRRSKKGQITPSFPLRMRMC